MEVRNIPERRNWGGRLAELGLAHECESWADDRFCAVSPREMETLRDAAERISARMKETLERCFTEPRLKTPWQLGPVEEASIRRSFSHRNSMAIQRLDFTETRTGVFSLTGVEVDPASGFLACALLQGQWLKDHQSIGLVGSDWTQFNRLNEALTSKIKLVGAQGKILHALFDQQDVESAAIAGYAVKLGIQAATDVRPVQYRSIGLPPVDAGGTPIEICWCSKSRKADRLVHSPLFTHVEFTTPAWYSLLPSVFEKMGEVAVVPPEDRRRHSDGTTATTSIWLLNTRAVAASCEITETEADKPKRVAHVIR